MSLRPGMRVLDVGCGVGGPAREIAQFSDARIVGLNNNEFQVQRARKYTKKAGLENQVTFVKGDFMNLVEQFGENSFDAGTIRTFPFSDDRLTLRLCSLCHRGYLPCTHMGRSIWPNHTSTETRRSCEYRQSLKSSLLLSGLLVRSL
jgi:SAM-dependent methyltransferase